MVSRRPPLKDMWERMRPPAQTSQRAASRWEVLLSGPQVSATRSQPQRRERPLRKQAGRRSTLLCGHEAAGPASTRRRHFLLTIDSAGEDTTQHRLPILGLGESELHCLSAQLRRLLAVRLEAPLEDRVAERRYVLRHVRLPPWAKQHALVGQRRCRKVELRHGSGLA